MTTIIVLAMHGAPPSDFPRQEAGELFGLRGRLERAAPPDRPALEARLRELDAKMRAWPRSAANDPYHRRLAGPGRASPPGHRPARPGGLQRVLRPLPG